jgi:hypothetical protein
MENLTKFKELLKVSSNLAEQFLCDVYFLSPFQAYTFVLGITGQEVDDLTLGYTFGAMDAHIGCANDIVNQLP